MDLNWMSRGGVLIDGSGDLAMGDTLSSLKDMVGTRLKTALDGWKLYRIGADLHRVIGETVSPELEIRIQRQVEAALLKDFLPQGSFTVKTLPSGSQITIYVYLQDKLLATETVDTKA